ncbi:MAG: hypothetical protein V1661_00985 [bacterium]
MQFKIPKDTQYLSWTKNAAGKMMFYGLSAAKVKSILSRYDRKEQGVAENTVAVMKKAGSEKHPQEIWVMYQDKEKQRVIIAAWRYPGISKERIPIPKEIVDELENK